MSDTARKGLVLHLMKKLRLRGVKVSQRVDGRSEMEDVSSSVILRRVNKILHVKYLAECLTHQIGAPIVQSSTVVGQGHKCHHVHFRGSWRKCTDLPSLWTPNTGQGRENLK